MLACTERRPRTVKHCPTSCVFCVHVGASAIPPIASPAWKSSAADTNDRNFHRVSARKQARSEAQPKRKSVIGFRSLRPARHLGPWQRNSVSLEGGSNFGSPQHVAFRDRGNCR